MCLLIPAQRVTEMVPSQLRCAIVFLIGIDPIDLAGIAERLRTAPIGVLVALITAVIVVVVGVP